MLQRHGYDDGHSLVTVIQEICLIMDGLIDSEVRQNAVFPDEVYSITNDTGFVVRLTGWDGTWLQINCEGVVRPNIPGRLHFLYEGMTEEDLWGEGINRDLRSIRDHQRVRLKEILGKLLAKNS
jgi:hypothetical protein